MTTRDYLTLLSQAEKLKRTMRHCVTGSGRQESVAEHSWRLALMAMLLSGVDEFSGTDLQRVIRMCLIHDLGESFTGDVPAFRKTEEDTASEKERFRAWVSGFPQSLREEWSGLLNEMEAMESPEARLWKALDKLEALISHNESDISTWLPLEYELQLTYGQENMSFSPWLTELRAVVDAWTVKKIAASEAPGNGDPKRPIE